MNYLIDFAIFVLGCAVGSAVTTRIAGRALGNLLNEFNIGDREIKQKARELGVDVSEFYPEETEEDAVREVTVEKINDNYLAYHYETDEFIAQASTPQQLFERLVEYFPANTRVNIDIDRGGHYFEDLVDKEEPK